jgi:protease-4
MVASAAYYMASFADYLMADNRISSAFGSIGVYVSWLDYRENLKQQGIEQRFEYAPQSTLKNNEFRQIMDSNDTQPLIDNVLKPSADRFIATVMQNRQGKIPVNSDAYKGKLFEGDSIVTEGLADGFGTLSDAIRIAASMAMVRR